MISITQNVDARLSMLPDEILAHILSLMPTKYAVRTSILSKRWMHTWTSVTNLDFDYTCRDPSNEEDFTKFVDRVLKLCKTSHVKLFRLHVSNDHYRMGSSVSNWIENAIRLNVRELDVCVIQHELPLSVFTCKTLTHLRLELRCCGFNGWEFPSSVYLPCLKTLDLAGSNICFSDALNLNSSCPVLESLSLEVYCFDEKHCILNISTLKRLKLIYTSDTNSYNNKTVLHVPKLEYLSVGGVLCSFFEMEDVSSLVGASIACWTSRKSFMWADLLNKIRGVQNLSIKSFPFTLPLPVFPNMKQLELNGVWKPGQTTHFLERCPLLKILCIDSVDWRVFESEESSWSKFEPKLVPACMLTSLTTIKFSKCEGDTCEIEFLEYMLGNAHVLKKVTIFALENLLVEEDPWFCAQVLKLPRVSPHCEIHFQPWKLPPPQPAPINVAL